jgi:uncharacterized membrane protein
MIRSFLEKLRNPDVDFLLHLKMLAMIIPLGLGFLITIIILVLMVTGAKFIAIPWLSKAFLYFIVTIMLLPYITLKILQVYVYFKLKNRGVQLQNFFGTAIGKKK